MAGKGPDDKIQKITKLLEKGGTMLATHHECGAPMFRYQGKVVCPVCDFQEQKPVKEPEQVKEPEAKRIEVQIEEHERMDHERMKKPVPADAAGMSRIISDKIRNLASSLETETDLGRVREKMDCIEAGLRILKLLREKD